MKFVRYLSEGTARVGILDGDFLIDMRRALDGKGSISDADKVIVSDMTALIRAGVRGRELALRALEAARAGGDGRRNAIGARILAPLEPTLILATGGNYRDHLEELAEIPMGKEPPFFFKAPGTVIGPGDGIELDPRITAKLDYEVELAVIIGKQGRHITEAEAPAHVYGYTILNDVTARDRQVTRIGDMVVPELGGSKNFDPSAPMGPVILTADEVPDPQNLRLSTMVNAELRQNNSTRNMIFGVYRLISFFSTFLTLRPGDVITTGTPGGTGWAGDAELGGKPYTRNDVVRATRYLAVGDVVRCEIEKIGVLSNTVVGAGK